MRTVVITGGTAGVGRALSRHFAKKGWNVAVIARGEARLEATAGEIRGAGREALTFSADVADAAAIEAAADAVAEKWGGIDLWINNAMTTVYSPFGEMTAGEYDRVNAVVYLGQVNGARAALKHMRKARRGRIVFVGSALAYRSIPLQSAYCAAKHAVRGFTGALRAELLHEGLPIGLTMTQLPTVNTPQFSWCRSKLSHEPDAPPPIYSPDAVAKEIYTAAIDGHDEVFIGRATVALVAGQTVMPHLLDRKVAGPGWTGQIGKTPQHGVREGNLFEPAIGDPGPEGKFSDRQTRRILSLDSDVFRGGMIAIAGGTAALFGYVIGRIGRRI